MGRWRRLNKGKVVGPQQRVVLCVPRSSGRCRLGALRSAISDRRSTAIGGTRAFQPQERGLDLSLPLLDLVARQLARSNLGRLACCACELRSRVAASVDALIEAAAQGNLPLLRALLEASPGSVKSEGKITFVD